MYFRYKMIVRYSFIIILVLITACSDGIDSQSPSPDENGDKTYALGTAVKTVCNSPAAPTATGSLTLSGHASYYRFPIAGDGSSSFSLYLDYNNPIKMPIRCAQVDLIEINANGARQVVHTVTTDLNGDYQLPAKENTSYDIHIKAALGTNTKANTEVIDHTDSFKVYALGYGQLTTSTTDMTLDDLTAHSKWNSDRNFYYDGVAINVSDVPAHPAGSFAILDTILDAQRKTDELSSGALASTTSFPSMQVTWAATKGLLTESTSYYQDGRLHILGKQNEDTDEFDEHVVAHEWGHYLVHAFSRDDTLSGDHKSRDFLDPTVAFSEGFANAFSAFSTGIEIYKDTNGADQRGRLVYNDLEKGDLGAANGAPLANALDLSYEGLYSEDSVAEIVVDILDAYNPNDLPVDTLQIPFSQIFTLLKTDFKTTPAFTSIVEFLFLLKNNTQNINDTAAKALIQQLADNENIGDIQEFENSGHAFADASLGANDKYEFYTTITANDGSVIKDSLGQYLFIGHNDYGTLYHPSTGRLNNKLLYRRFFVTSPTTAGCYELSAKSVNGDPIGIETPIDFVKAIKQSETLNLDIAANKPIGFAVFANSLLNFSVKVRYIADRCD